MAKGVAFNPPPAASAPTLTAAILKAVDELPAGSKGALVAVATPKGVNAAVVGRLSDGWAVQAWVGKTWDRGVDGAVSIMKSW